MNHTLSTIDKEIERLTAFLINQQQQDGSWYFCFENGIVIDAYVIILFRILNVPNEDLIRQLHDRILAEQQPAGFWQLYRDEKEETYLPRLKPTTPFSTLGIVRRQMSRCCALSIIFNPKEELGKLLAS